MCKYKTYFFVTLFGVMVVGIVSVVARYFKEIRAAQERLNSY